jgi:hypothetical protein
MQVLGYASLFICLISIVVFILNARKEQDAVSFIIGFLFHCILATFVVKCMLILKLF